MKLISVQSQTGGTPIRCNSSARNRLAAYSSVTVWGHIRILLAGQSANSLWLFSEADVLPASSPASHHCGPSVNADNKSSDWKCWIYYLPVQQNQSLRQSVRVCEAVTRRELNALQVAIFYPWPYHEFARGQKVGLGTEVLSGFQG